MRTFKKVVAWVVVVLAVLGLLAVLAGLVGSWMVRNRVTTFTLDLLTVGETAVAATTEGLNRIDARLDISQDRLDILEGNINDVGGDLQENSLVGTAISNNISDELATSITEARATAVAVKDTALALDEAIKTANEIPFVSLEGAVPELIGEMADGLIALEERVADFREEVQERREERIENSVDLFSGITSDIGQRIGNIQSGISESKDRLDGTSAKLATAKVSLARTFTMITILVNLLLLVIGLAFVSLLLHGLSFIKNPDQGWQDLVSGPQ